MRAKFNRMGCSVLHSPPMPDLDEVGYWRLAVAVLRQAVEDVADERLPAADREQARSFLRGGGYLQLWTAVLGLPTESVRRRGRLSCDDAIEAPAPLPARVPPRPRRRAPAARPDASAPLPSILDVPPRGWFIEPRLD